jgi:hypothetical protein
MTPSVIATSASATNPFPASPIDPVEQHLIPVEAVQKILNRSRASIYRYANTDANLLNLPFDPKRLNPEMRKHKDDPLMFHPNEVARFAQDVLGIKQVTIEIAQSAESVTNELLTKILAELQAIRQILSQQR